MSPSDFKPAPIECQENETYQILDVSQSNLEHIQQRVSDEQQLFGDANDSQSI